jgi:hypothetical protein
MAWKFENPLYSLTTEDQNSRAKDVWEGESLGGIMEDNNRLPRPVVWLLLLTIVTAFLVTAPLWGQRPTAAIYAEYIAMMDSPEVQAIQDDAGKMAHIVQSVKSKGSKYEALQDRHPVEMDDLRVIKDKVIELENAGVDLEEYTIVGDKVVLANFEGNLKPDGTKTRKQPWWDKGYTIDIFYVTYFCLAVMIAVKRLPNHEWQPDHAKAH